jgi:hypothetical protein
MMLLITKVRHCDFQEQVLLVSIDIRPIEKRKMKDAGSRIKYPADPDPGSRG